MPYRKNTKIGFSLSRTKSSMTLSAQRLKKKKKKNRKEWLKSKWASSQYHSSITQKVLNKTMMSLTKKLKGWMKVPTSSTQRPSSSWRGWASSINDLHLFSFNSMAILFNMKNNCLISLNILPWEYQSAWLLNCKKGNQQKIRTQIIYVQNYHMHLILLLHFQWEKLMQTLVELSPKSASTTQGRMAPVF